MTNIMAKDEGWSFIDTPGDITGEIGDRCLCPGCTARALKGAEHFKAKLVDLCETIEGLLEKWTEEDRIEALGPIGAKHAGRRNMLRTLIEEARK